MQLNTKKYFFTGFIPHQATFIPRQLLLTFPYNENLKIVSDYEFIIKVHFRHNVQLCFLKKIISLCDENGLSNNPKYKKLALREFRYIRYKYFGVFYLFYSFKYKLYKLKKFLKRLTKFVFLKIILSLL